MNLHMAFAIVQDLDSHTESNQAVPKVAFAINIADPFELVVIAAEVVVAVVMVVAAELEDAPYKMVLHHYNNL